MNRSSLLDTENNLLKAHRSIKHSQNGYLVSADEKIINAIWDLEQILEKD